jgi:phosphate-selective porin OprO and OprP
VDVIFYKWITAKIQAELTEGISLKNAYIDLAFLPEARLRLGQFQVPFSLEELTSSRFIDFVERSIVNALAPYYDRGIMLHGDLLQGGISYYLGGFNGTGEDTSDNNGDKDLAFRLAFVPFRSSESFWLKGLHLAGDVTWGNEDSINSPQGQTGARTLHRFTFFAAQPTRGDRLRYGGDMAWLIGPASLKFEYHVQQNARNQLGPGGSNLDDVVATGWYVSGTYIITGEDKPFNGAVVPKRPFSPFLDHMGPGGWEVGVHFASLDFDSDSPLNFFNGNLAPAQIPGGGTRATNSAQALTVGFNWYLNERVRSMFNWTNYWYENSLGTPFSCTLGSCSAAQLRGADRKSWEILSRLQVWF